MRIVSLEQIVGEGAIPSLLGAQLDIGAMVAESREFFVDDKSFHEFRPLSLVRDSKTEQTVN